MKWYFAVLKKYANFKGRARRSEYWFFSLFNFIIFFALAFLSNVLSSFNITFALIYFVYMIAVLLPSLAVAVRRMHDVNKSGWHIFIPVYSLILSFTDGTTGANKYGSDPKRPEYDEFLEVSQN